MDPATLATTVFAVLTPYLVKARGKLAEEVGGSLPEHARKEAIFIQGSAFTGDGGTAVISAGPCRKLS